VLELPAELRELFNCWVAQASGYAPLNPGGRARDRLSRPVGFVRRMKVRAPGGGSTGFIDAEWPNPPQRNSDSLRSSRPTPAASRA
jgi:hypothetical protein